MRHARIVDEDIDVAELGQRFLQHGVHVRLLADVGAKEARLRAEGGGRLRAFFLDVDQHHLRPFGDQAGGASQADALRGARDDGGFID